MLGSCFCFASFLLIFSSHIGLVWSVDSITSPYQWNGWSDADGWAAGYRRGRRWQDFNFFVVPFIFTISSLILYQLNIMYTCSTIFFTLHRVAFNLALCDRFILLYYYLFFVKSQNYWRMVFFMLFIFNKTFKIAVDTMGKFIFASGGLPFTDL